MFIINLTYKTGMDKVNDLLTAHIEFLDEQYELGHFLASGRKIPRTGGIILARSENKSELEKIISKDPFHANDVADYDLIEFVPSKTCEELSFLLA